MDKVHAYCLHIYPALLFDCSKTSGVRAYYQRRKTTRAYLQVVSYPDKRNAKRILTLFSWCICSTITRPLLLWEIDKIYYFEFLCSAPGKVESGIHSCYSRDR